MTTSELEAKLPRGAILTAYSGLRARLGSTPADYEQVFVYASDDEIKRAFKSNENKERNLFVLAPDKHLTRLSESGAAPPVQIYVDLWQLGAPGSRFVQELEREFAPASNRALEEIAKELGKKCFESTN